MNTKYSIAVDKSVTTLDFDTCQKVLGGMESVFANYPQLAQNIKTVSIMNRGVMCCSGETLYFNPKYFKDTSGFMDMCKRCSDSGWWPKNSSPAAIGVHETGHAVEKLLLSLSPEYTQAYERVFAWNRGEIAKEIVSAALKAVKKTEYGKGKKNAELVLALSEYATKNKQETFAEAFADVFSNGESANPLSVEIRKLALERYKQLMGGGGNIRMMTKPDWWQYATFDEDGFLKGIRDDAPETAKAEYAKWKKDDDSSNEQGIKI